MTLNLVRSTFMCVLAASSSLQASAAPVCIKYYEEGKRIPAAANAPPFYPYKEQKRRIGSTVMVAYSFGQDGKVTAAYSLIPAAMRPLNSIARPQEDSL